MRDKPLTYWKCRHCHGTGKLAPHWSDHIETCRDCDGTGNALVDGAAAAHRREIERREAQKR